MKNRRIWVLALVLLLCVSTLVGCSNRNVKEELPGEWFIWHWYYNVTDGDNGFFDEAQFYTFDGEGTLTMTVNGETTTAAYSFSADDIVDVVYADGTVDTFQLIPSEHDGVDQIQFSNIHTNYTLTLEPMSSWSE